jgi:hypothetical protein
MQLIQVTKTNNKTHTNREQELPQGKKTPLTHNLHKAKCNC